MKPFGFGVQLRQSKGLNTTFIQLPETGPENIHSLEV